MQDILLKDLHPILTGSLHDRWKLVEFVFSDEIRDSIRLHEDLFYHLQSRAIRLTKKTLGEYGCEGISELESDLILLPRWE